MIAKSNVIKGSVFDEHGKEGLRRFAKAWTQMDPNLDPSKAELLAQQAVQYYRGGASARSCQRPMQELEGRWYASLEQGAPDYSVYDDRYILSDIWACWETYSRKYLLSLRNPKGTLQGKSIASIIAPVRRIIDLGCGFGYTTAGLKELFPDAQVTGTNIEGCCQWKLAKQVGKLRGFRVCSNEEAMKDEADLVFASEYFEHILDALDHLENVLNCCKPKYLIVANSFGTISVGHFHVYESVRKVAPDAMGSLFDAPGKVQVKSASMSKLFGKVLRGQGYRQVETKLWNNRPAWWTNIPEQTCRKGS